MYRLLSRILGHKAASTRRSPLKRSLSLETLEVREVPAVSVTTTVGGDLVINGDAGNDRIQMSQLPNGATFIQGMDGTVVNRVANGRVIMSFNNNLRVNLGNGDNLLYVVQGNGGVVANNAFITTGSGKDSIQFYQLTLSNDLVIDTGAGDDGVYLNYVTAKALGAIPNSSDHGISVFTRGGSDWVGIYNTTSGLDVAVLLDDSNVGAPGGNDTLDMYNVLAVDDFWIYGFGGNDNFTMNTIRSYDNLMVDMGDGNNYLKLTYANAGTIGTYGGSGINTVQYYSDGFYTWNESGIDGFINRP
jgi:hypothetical protein